MRRLLGISFVVAVLGACSAPTAGQPLPAPSPSAGSPAPTSPPPTTPPAEDGFTVIAGGDILIHPALTEQALADGGGSRDYAPLLAGIRPAVEAADLAVCHLEVPLAGPEGQFEGYPRFIAPPEVATGLKETGYDVCTTASNHTMDHGESGALSTLDALEAAGLAYTGSARTEEEAGTPLILDVPGAKVGWLSYTFAFNTGTQRPAGKPWMANVIDPDAIVADAEAAREQGADVVVASLHWGVEGSHEATAEQRATAERLLSDPAIDLIIGHHAHVMQPFEKVAGKWVAYGLGNQVARHAEPKGTTEEGALARFRFTRDGDTWTVTEAEYLPTLVDLGPPIRLRDLTADGGGERAAEAVERTTGIVTSLGADDDGLLRPGG